MEKLQKVITDKLFENPIIFHNPFIIYFFYRIYIIQTIESNKWRKKKFFSNKFHLKYFNLILKLRKFLLEKRTKILYTVIN